MTYLYVGLGGAIGAIARALFTRLLPHPGMPLPILLVNILGCFAMGCLIEIFALYWNASLNTRHFLIQSAATRPFPPFPWNSDCSTKKGNTPLQRFTSF